MSDPSPTPDTAASRVERYLNERAAMYDAIHAQGPDKIHLSLTEQDLWALLADARAARSVAGTPTPDWSALCDAAEEFARAYRGNDEVEPWTAIDKICAALGGQDPYNPSGGSGTAALAEDQPWHDAGLSVWHGWNRFSNARTPIEVADAINDLSNAVSDLGTFLPVYDYETGTVGGDGDE